MPQLTVNNSPVVVEGFESPLLEILGAILLELRALRLATVAIAIDGGRAKEADFDPALLKAELDVLTQP
jgi:hypothetical protein